MPIDRTNCTATRHGTYSAYRRGCRCPDAREDHRLQQKRWREHRAPVRLVPATGTIRRIHGLLAAGHTYSTIASAASTSGYHITAGDVGRIACLRRFIKPHTAQAIGHACRILIDVPGTSKHARSRARAAGYAPLAAWDNIDDPDAQPNTGDPTAEPDDTVRRANYLELRDLGSPIEEAARRADIARSTARRYEAAWRRAEDAA
jgi:hypothetical protein